MGKNRPIEVTFRDGSSKVYDSIRQVALDLELDRRVVSQALDGYKSDLLKIFRCGVEDIKELESVLVNQCKIEEFEQFEKFGSGGYREFKTSKPSFMGLAPIGLERVAMRCTYGKLKYGDLSGFGKGKELPCAETMDSALRHINQYLQGDNSEDHLAAAVWNLLVVMQTEVESPSWNNIRAREGLDVYYTHTTSK